MEGQALALLSLWRRCWSFLASDAALADQERSRNWVLPTIDGQRSCWVSPEVSNNLLSLVHASLFYLVSSLLMMMLCFLQTLWSGLLCCCFALQYNITLRFILAVWIDWRRLEEEVCLFGDMVSSVKGVILEKLFQCNYTIVTTCLRIIY